MSDEPTKRGRKAEKKTEKIEVEKESKKRPRKETKPVESGAGDTEDGATPVKRGRGRPKGSTKKKNAHGAAKVTKPKGLGRRGRPKREEAKESAEEDGEENDANEEEDDD
ncbi:high mobility group protein HMG-I/HMG-Y [Onthophagus taurus]|uniref:high mobility group protein HMG-I/HMG-Y n=1 Tax=Onthophagus taurus TaxID=166361 RepID=UPI000C208286|nr:uncharacterized protein LOC111417037 [Onthophagus taurus]XP_022904958.1 uncharacterized protein LOC111417037 [Onthophagus taurus]